MKLVAVCCNNCGARIEIGDSAKFAACNYCGSQLAVHRSGSATFTAKLESIEENTRRANQILEGSQEVLEDIRIENEIARLDREITMAQERLLRRDKRGNLQEDVEDEVVLYCLGAIVLGGAWTMLFMKVELYALCLPGVIAATVGGAILYTAYKRVEKFRQMKQSYERARADLLAQLQKHSARGSPRTGTASRPRTQ